MPLTQESALRKDMTTTAHMQHRHFATIARIINEIEDDRERDAIALHFADRLGRTNRNFDRNRFRRACNTHPKEVL